jgi:hypothetical protein
MKQVSLPPLRGVAEDAKRLERGGKLPPYLYFFKQKRYTMILEHYRKQTMMPVKGRAFGLGRENRRILTSRLSRLIWRRRMPTATMRITSVFHQG